MLQIQNKKRKNELKTSIGSKTKLTLLCFVLFFLIGNELAHVDGSYLLCSVVMTFRSNRFLWYVCTTAMLT